jgi:hypothetical protein
MSGISCLGSLGSPGISGRFEGSRTSSSSMGDGVGRSGSDIREAVLQRVEQRFYLVVTRNLAAELHRTSSMAKPDLQNFSLPGRILFGIVAVFLIWWLLTITGTI